MNNEQYLEENKAEIDFGYIITLSVLVGIFWSTFFWLIVGVIMGMKTNEIGCFLATFLVMAVFTFFSETLRVRKLKKQLGL